VYSTAGIFSILRADIVLHRKVGYFILQVFIPSILLVALSWVSFWIDACAVPARITLGVTCVLTMTTLSSGIRQTLPPVSYIKAIDVWMSVCLMFVFSALLEFAYVNNLMRRSKMAETGNISKVFKQVVRLSMCMVSQITRTVGKIYTVHGVLKLCIT